MRLRELMKENGWTQQTLADHIGVARSTVGMWVTGRNEPDNYTLVQLAMLFNCSVDFLLGKTDTRIDSGLLDILSAIPDELLQRYGNVYDALRAYGLSPRGDLHHQSVPMLGSVAAGKPIYDEEVGVYVDSPAGCDAALTGRGDSMAPAYQDGDLVYIKCRPDVPDGTVAVVFLDDEATLKRVFHIVDGLSLFSDNPAYNTINVKFADYDNVRIFGVPVGYTRMYKKGIEGKIKKGMK